MDSLPQDLLQLLISHCFVDVVDVLPHVSKIMSGTLTPHVYEKVVERQWSKRYKSLVRSPTTIDWRKEFKISNAMHRDLESHRQERVEKYALDKLLHVCRTAPFPVLLYIVLLLFHDKTYFGLNQDIDLDSLLSTGPRSLQDRITLATTLTKHFVRQNILGKRRGTFPYERWFWDDGSEGDYPRSWNRVLCLWTPPCSGVCCSGVYIDEYFFDDGAHVDEWHWGLSAFFEMQQENFSIRTKTDYLTRFSRANEIVTRMCASKFEIRRDDFLGYDNYHNVDYPECEESMYEGRPYLPQCTDAIFCLYLGAILFTIDEDDWTEIIEYVKVNEAQERIFPGASEILRTHLQKK